MTQRRADSEAMLLDLRSRLRDAHEEIRDVREQHPDGLPALAERRIAALQRQIRHDYHLIVRLEQEVGRGWS